MRVSRLIGLASLVLPLASAAGAPIPVTGRILEELLKLAQGITLTGTVVDAADRPVVGVQILAVPSLALAERPDWTSVRSESDGGFRVAGLRPGIVYEITAVHEGFSQTRTAARTPTDGRPAAPLRIVMKEGKNAFGRVVNEAGGTVPGAEVELSDDRGASLKATSGEDGASKSVIWSPGHGILWRTRAVTPTRSVRGSKSPPERRPSIWER
jgi:Carboxypeptidase regulatory-like domain